MSTLVDTTTGEIVETATAEDARRLTDKIKIGVEGVWHLIEEAYTSRAWAALGYKSWDDYCTREFGTSRLRLPREDRSEVVASLRESGLSVRAIAVATGDHYSTVSRELSRVANATPAHQASAKPATGSANPAVAETEVAASGVAESSAESLTGPLAPRSSVTGTDGKTYPASQPTRSRPSRKPLTDSFFEAVYDLARKAESVSRLTEDDRFPQNAEKVAAKHRNDLIRTRDLLTQVIEQLTEKDTSE